MILEATEPLRIEAFFSMIYLIGSILFGAIWDILYEILKSEPTPETKSVVILGMPGAGKTTMWHHLRGISAPRLYANTDKDEVSEFEFAKKQDGTPLKIATTSDLGGQGSFVGSEYDKLIKRDSFILFFMSTEDLQDEKKRKDIEKRLEKIQKIVSENNLKGSVALQFVITKIDLVGQSKANEYKELLTKQCKVSMEAIHAGDLRYRDGELFQSLRRVLKSIYAPSN